MKKLNSSVKGGNDVCKRLHKIKIVEIPIIDDLSDSFTPESEKRTEE